LGGGGAGPVSAADTAWLPSWGTTLQRTEDSNEPPPLAGKTLRQFIWPSYTGSEIRIELSNERGEGPVEMSKVHIAHAEPLGRGSIDASTDAVFTFGGSESVTIAPGERVWSDALSFDFLEMQPMAVSILFGANAPADVTGHPGARTTSYIADGDVVSEASISGETRDRWYYLSMVDVMAPADAYAVAVLGDSITDGYGVLNEFARWPDFLNVAINQDPMIADKVSVLNFGMGANSLTAGGADQDPGTERFERDVLGRADKIRWLIVLIGVNDLIYGNVQAGPITSAYQSIVDQSHAAGILAFGSPITPFGSHTQGAPLGVRTEVNDWVNTSGAFDAVVDLAAAVADPSDAEQLNPPMSNDGLHPNTVGYEAMGNAVDLSLFYPTMP
jgi:lysophospholipase L1-like esterase